MNRWFARTPALARIAGVGGLIFTMLCACDGGDDNDSDGDEGGATGSGGGSSATCYSVAVNDSHDGSSACGPEVCQGGEYCASDVGICDPGCRNELECPLGQYCDLSNSGGSDVGMCREPGAELEVPCTDPATCSTRCRAKAQDCGAPDDVAQQQCAALCPMVSEEQLSCLESTSCEELEKITQGQAVCGIGPIE